MKYFPSYFPQPLRGVLATFAAVAIWLGQISSAWGQGQVPPLTFPTQGGTTFGTGVPPQGSFIPSAQPGAPTLGVPFDPYGSSRTVPTPYSFPGMGQGSIFGGQPNPTGGGFFGQPANPYGIPQPPVTAPTWPGATANPYGANPYGAGGAPVFNGGAPAGNPFGPGSPYYNGPGSPYYNPAQQPSMFPGGMNWGGTGYGGQKVFQDFGFRYTWIGGEEDQNDVDINDAEIHGTIVFPGFLNVNAPLLVTPGFVFHLWDGPHPMNLAALPAQAYSAYLDFAWQSPPEQVIGADLNFRVGAYSAFNTFNTKSFRYQGQGLGLIRLTPAMTLKGGVRYIDRLHYKLLPAAGILWQPNPQVKLDIFFPQPKLAMYLTTVGTAQVWGYVTAEYGGGSWTIKQAGVSERVELSDFRVLGGFEWFGSQGVNGFVEGGYIFNREVYYTVSQDFEANATFIVRGGLSF